MNVAIKPDSQRFVEDQLRTGHYASPEDVVQAGLKLLQERQANMGHLRAMIAQGLDQARRGELLDGEGVLDEIFGSEDTASNAR